MAVRSVNEFNITNYANIANASAQNVQVDVEVRVTLTDGTPQTFTRTARFIQDVWNQMASDADGREVLRQHVQELAKIRAMVFAGVANYSDFI